MFTKHLFSLFGLFLYLTALSGSITATSSIRNWIDNNIKREESFFEKANRIANEHPNMTWVAIILGITVITSISPFILKEQSAMWRILITFALSFTCSLFFYSIFMFFFMWFESNQRIGSRKNSLSFGSGFSMPSGGTVRGLEEVPPGQMGLILDLILLFLILLGAFRGYKNGLFSQLFSSFAILVFLIFGRPLFDNTAMMLSHWWPALDEGSISFLAIMALFMCLLFVLFVLERILKRVLQLTFLGYFDSLLGAIVGIVKTSFFLVVFISLIDLYGITLSEEYTANMRIYNTIHSFVPRCIDLLQAYLPKYLLWFTEK